MWPSWDNNKQVLKSIFQNSRISLCVFPEQLPKLNFQFSKHCCFHFLNFLMLMFFMFFLLIHSSGSLLILWLKLYIYIKPHTVSICLWVQNSYLKLSEVGKHWYLRPCMLLLVMLRSHAVPGISLVIWSWIPKPEVPNTFTP